MTKMKAADPNDVKKLVDLALSKKIEEIVEDYPISTVIVTMCALTGTLACLATDYDREDLGKFMSTLFWVLQDSAAFELKYGENRNRLDPIGEIQA
jgi:hypothetical protein